MHSHGDLFALESWDFEPEKSQNEPFLWVKEFRFYSALQKDKLVRKVSLHPGINVLWAKPADVKNVSLKQSGGISGHSAGKSLFCRLLRFLLGESTFATKPVKEAILNQFFNAVVAAEIVVNGTHWLVIRHLATGQGEVLRDATIEQLFEENLFREPYKVFREYLNQTMISRMALKTFPGSDKAIEWGHILPFLSRDQECRMQNLAQWRDKASESDAPSPTVAENCHVIRGILGLMSEQEAQLIREHSRLIARKNELEKEIPAKHYHFLQQRRSFLQVFPQASLEEFSLGNEDMMILNFERLASNLAERIAACKTQRVNDDVALNVALVAEREASQKEGELKEQKRLLYLDLQRLRQMLGQPSKSKLSWLERNANAAPNRCNVLREDAKKHGCPFFLGKPIDLSSQVNFGYMLDDAISAQKKGLLQQRAYVSKLNQEWSVLKKKARQAKLDCDIRLQNFNIQYTNELDRKSKLLSQQKILADVMAAYQEYIQAKDESKNLENKIKDSLDDQRMWRTQSSIKAREQNFNEIFQEVLRNILEPEITAKIEILADRINLEAQYNGNVRGTTLDIVKIIAFDYASLILGIENTNGHPGFLIHDSPREADMSEDIYQRMLLFLKSTIEDRCTKGVPFQYIITTTAKPPVQLSSSPWLLTPILDASTAHGRLLGIDF